MGAWEELASRLRLRSATSRLTAKGRARRRFNCGKQAEWDERAITAVGVLRANRDSWLPSAGGRPRVADFGAGNERLRPLLAELLGREHEYCPFDLHPQLPTTAPLDVSLGLPERDFDLAICLGLLEYLPSIPDLALSLRRHCRSALVSYVTSDSPVAIDRPARERHAWKTHLTGAEVEAAFESAGFAAADRTRSDGEATTIWLWRGAGR